MAELRLPPPGLDGTYTGSCIVCFKGTDTALSFEGQAEWVIAALMRLGLPEDHATPLVLTYCRDKLGCDEGQVPGHDIAPVFQVCSPCAAKAGMRVSNAAIGEAMLYRQPDDQRMDD